MKEDRVTAEPPVDDGATQLTLTDPFPYVAATLVGTPGAVTATAETDEVQALVFELMISLTRK